MQQIVAIRILNFKSIKNKFKAFQWMGSKLSAPWKASGLGFSKHMGVGAGNGFSIIPDFSKYVFIGVFDSEQDSKDFFSKNQEWLEFNSLAESWFGFDGIAIKGHGLWNGKNPFIIQEDIKKEGKVAVITRASIDWKKAHLFWLNVPNSSRHLEKNKDLIFAKGVGEMPIVEQATLSIWKNHEALENFAYRSNSHRPMIQKTRKIKWYKEELFIRLRVVKEYFIE